MTVLTLRLREAPPVSVDASILSPPRLAGLTRTKIEALELELGNRSVRVGDLFEVGGDDWDNVVIENATERLTHLGAGMQSGTLVVNGNAGAYLGFGMSAGRISVSGNGGIFAGCEMEGGTIEIGGDAGDWLGSALAGDKQGMQGGLIHVGGNAGDRAADRMRRGVVLIEGRAGAYLGSRMLAGTVIVKGDIGQQPGFALKHGTLLLLSGAPELPATYNDCGRHELLFLALLERDLRTRGGLQAFLPLPRTVRRYCGDLANGGKGEILLNAMR
jgi:formylmethanofuran dehydrogenase subunit C